MKKLLLFIFMFIFLVGNALAVDWTSAVVCYNMDETSGSVVVDSMNNFNGTKTAGVLINQPGGIKGTAFNFTDSATASIDLTGLTDSSGGNYSVSFWGNAEDVGALVFDTYGTRTAYAMGQAQTSGNLGFYDGAYSSLGVVAPFGTLTHYLFVMDNANNTGYIYVNGNRTGLNGSYDITSTIGGAVSISGDANTPANSNYNGIMDNFVLFNETKNQTEADDLFNSGAGVDCLQTAIDPTAPLVTLIDPSNNASLSDIEANFTVNHTAGSFNLTNTTYYVWFSNGTLFNNSITVSISGTENSTTEIIDHFILENYDWNALTCQGNGNGTNCSFAESNFSFLVGATIDAETFDPFVFETELTLFQTNLTLVPGATLYDQDLIYNGTSYKGTQTILGTDQYSISINLPVPLLAGSASENRSFYWSITFERADGSFFFQNLTMDQQNVSQILMTTCTSGNMALNFTTWDEENINIQLQPFDFFGTFFYWLGDGSVYKNLSVSNVSINSTQFCISDPTLTFRADANIQYEKDNFVKRSYFLINASLTNITSHIKLALLNETASTSFIIDVIDENQLPVPNVYINIQRYYPGLGIYQTVEMGKTDTGGSTVGHFEAETEDYKVIITSNNTVLFQSEAQKIFCRDTPCTLTFQIGSVDTTQWIPFGDVTGLLWSLNFSESTKLWTYTFIDTTGAAQNGRLHVYKDKPTSKFTICNSTVSSSAGTITCNISGQTGTVYAAAYITQSPEILVYLKSAIIGSLNDVFGLEGLFLSTFILLILAMAGLWNPVVGILLVSVGMIMMSFIGLASFGSVALWSIIFIGLIIAWGMKT